MDTSEQQYFAPPEPSHTQKEPRDQPVPNEASQEGPRAMRKHKQRTGARLLEGTRHLWRRRVPLLSQMSAVECGAACLAMILSYYGRKTSIAEIREHCGIGRDGLDAFTIVRTAQEYGMQVRALSLEKSDLYGLPLPAIVHWEFNHFLIVELWSQHRVTVVDPAWGRRNLSVEEFDSAFTGIVILLVPGTHFVRRRARPPMTLGAYLAKYTQAARTILFRIIGASLLLQVLGLAVPLLTKVLVDWVIPLHITDIMTLLGAGLSIYLCSYLVTTLLRAYLVAYLQAQTDKRITVDFFQHLLSLPLPFFNQRSSGDILTRLTSNAVIREIISNQLISTILDGGLIVVYLVILFWQAPAFASIALAIGLFQALLLAVAFPKLQVMNNRELKLQGRSYGFAAEALGGIATLKSAGAEQYALAHWSNLFFDYLEASTRRVYFVSLTDALGITLRTGSALVLLWIGTGQVLAASMPVGTMLALNALAAAFLTPLSSLIASGQQLQVMYAHFERISDIMSAPSEQKSANKLQTPKLQGQITLRNVSFHYDRRSPAILQKLNVHIEAGQKVAIVGPTGSGKSTLGFLLLGLYMPTEGEILYDSIPLLSMDYQAVRAQFGAVIQDATIFSGSIRENIAFNQPHIEMEQIIRASKMAALHEDILRMPMQYETFVSEQGKALSGGQRQRLALARALVHSPMILLLDEATSHLDVVTEQVVDRGLSTLACTRIVIAHRLSTVRNADLILVLDEGTIVERGTHTELMALGGYYARLVQSQISGGEGTY